MDPVPMRIILAVVGALVGAVLGSEQSRFFDVLIGALTGFAVADLSYIRARLRDIEEDIDQLKRTLAGGAHSRGPEAAAQNAPAPPTGGDVLPEPAGTRSILPPPWRELEERPAPLRLDEPVSATSAPLSEPEMLQQSAAIGMIQRYFGGGNLLVRSGVIVLFFGIAFLLRYLAEHSRVPIELRLSGVALGGVALLTLGWRLRQSREGFALALQGGAVGILYLTVFAALHLYALMPAVAAFALLVSIAVLTAILAVLQNSQSLALLGVTGGFLAPVLASTGQGDHVFLFSYYAILNGGILLISWFKAWRGLNLAGFAFTFGVGTIWGVLTYRAADFATTEPFLILFFLFYVGIAVLFTWRQPVRLRGYVDGILVFGTPLIAFGLQASMLHDRRLPLAYSALATSAMYVGMAALLKQRSNDSQRLLIEAFLGLGVVFLTLAIPLALGSRWNAGAWALEGGALLWVGCRQGGRLTRLFGVLLILAAGCLMFNDFSFIGDHLTLPWNAYLVVLLLAIASIGSAKTLQVHSQNLKPAEAMMADLLFCWGVLWWSLGGLAELSHWVSALEIPSASLIFISLTACAMSFLYGKLPLRSVAFGALSLFPIMLIFAIAAAIGQSHPFEHGGWIGWPVAFACFYVSLYRHEAAAERIVADALHVGSAWLLIALLSWEGAWTVDFLIHGSQSWPAVFWAVCPAAAMLGLPRAAARMPWVARHRDAYLFVAAGGLAGFLVFWSVVTEFTMTGDVKPLPYAPLLNPVDIVQVVVLWVLRRYLQDLRTARFADANVDWRVPQFALAALGFLWLNASLLRTLHQWVDVPLTMSGLIQSTIAQTTLSIFWTCLALAAMLFATRKLDRSVWFAGSGLLAAVILKLFFIDLSSVGSIERIVSFVGVGLLMLVIGYYSPLPPRPRT
jgi:uncharacterized membrane protein